MNDTKNKAAYTRKKDQILACKYGHQWPLGLHTHGYVKILDSLNGLYVWADSKKTLKAIGKV